MTKIAIVGQNGAKIIQNTLTELLNISELTVFSYDDKRFSTFKQLAYESADVFIAPISTYLLEQKKLDIDVIIFSSFIDQINAPIITNDKCLKLINENAYIIINPDDKQAYKYLLGSRANLLTYGFNSKASVTASSILENMDKKFIQICIQRSFVAKNGLVIEAQEIPVTLSLNKNAHVLNEIAAITAALSLGIHTKIISLFVGRVNPR